MRALAIMYSVAFAFDSDAGPSRVCLDYIIEQRGFWWHRIAEIGRQRRQPIPAPSYGRDSLADTGPTPLPIKGQGAASRA